MHIFTNDDYRKIQQWLLANAVKDTDLTEVNVPFKGSEVVSVVQDGQNKRVFLKDLVSQIHGLGISDFFNVTDKCSISHITLEEAIKAVPSKARKIGQVITFINKEGYWQIYQFKGALNQWNILDQWDDLFDWEKLIIDSILPDEEDLTKSIADENGNSYLSLKDREYDPENYSGMGKIILRKNIVEIEDIAYGSVTKNVLYQDMFTQSNTVYEIRYDFDLNGQEITIPENCVLKFEGGSIGNGSIKGNNTFIKNSNEFIFKTNLNYKGGFNIKYIDIEWFGALSDLSNGIGTDCSCALQKAVDWSFYHYGISILIKGCYYLGKTINVTDALNLRGYRVPCKILIRDGAEPSENNCSTIYVKEGITAFNIKGRGGNAKTCNINVQGIKFTSTYRLSDDKLTWLGGETILISSDAIGGPSRPHKFIENTVECFYKVLDFDSSKIDGETQFFNFDISRNQIDNCGTIFSFTTFERKKGSGLITITNNILEASIHTFDIHNTFGFLEIKANLLENCGSSYIGLTNPSNLDIIGNYWEAMKGDFEIVGRNYASSVRIVQNCGGYNQANASGAYRIRLKGDISLLDYDVFDLNDVIFDHAHIHNVSPRIRLNSIPLNNITNSSFILPFNNIKTINNIDPENEYWWITTSFNELDLTPSLKTAFILKNAYQSVGTVFAQKGDIIALSFYKKEQVVRFRAFSSGNALSDWVYTSYESGYYTILIAITEDLELSRIQLAGYATNDNDEVEISNVLSVNITQSSIPYEIGLITDGKRNFGTTYYRPKYSEKIIGEQFFDNQYNKPVWWNGIEWIDATGGIANHLRSGLFQQKPSQPSIGFEYFCTDRQTTEGATDGIMIYYKGDNVWVDALGRVVE